MSLETQNIGDAVALLARAKGLRQRPATEIVSLPSADPNGLGITLREDSGGHIRVDKVSVSREPNTFVLCTAFIDTCVNLLADLH